MRTGLQFGIIAVIFAAAPFIVSAQSSELTQTIRAEIMKDPRSASIPATELNAMVASLAQAAEAQGITQSDITWRPVDRSAPASEAPTACGFICRVNTIFGFGGDDFTIPIGLGITSALLIIFMSMMFHRHHVHGVEPSIEALHTVPEPVLKKKK